MSEVNANPPPLLPEISVKPTKYKIKVELTYNDTRMTSPPPRTKKYFPAPHECTQRVLYDNMILI